MSGYKIQFYAVVKQNYWFIIIITIDHWIDMRLRHKASELNLIQAWLGESTNHKSQTLRKGSNINSTLHGFLTSDLPVALRQTTSMELQKQPSISKWVTLQGFSEDMGREGRYFCFMFFFPYSVRQTKKSKISLLMFWKIFKVLSKFWMNNLKDYLTKWLVFIALNWNPMYFMDWIC